MDMRILGLSGEKVVNYNLMYPVSPQNLVSLYGGRLLYDRWKPYLCFEHEITTSHFIRKINENELIKSILKGFKDFRIKWRGN